MYSSVYTLRFGTSIPRVFSLRHVLAWWGHLQVRLGCCTITFFFATLPHTGQCSRIGSAWYMFFLFALFLPSILFFVKSLNFCIIPRVKLVKIYFWSNITILLKYFFSQLLQLLYITSVTLSNYLIWVYLYLRWGYYFPLFVFVVAPFFVVPKRIV
jgi:hypothetical protein